MLQVLCAYRRLSKAFNQPRWQRALGLPAVPFARLNMKVASKIMGKDLIATMLGAVDSVREQLTTEQYAAYVAYCHALR